MERIIECVPNFSEGCNREVIEAIAAAIENGGGGVSESTHGVKILHIDSGQAANRTVITFTGSPEAVTEAAFQGVRKAAELIDMREHKGTHPRSGSTDVLPLVPISGITLEECAALARKLAQRIYDELGIPCYCYEAAAFKPERKNLAVCRAGEYEGLPAKILDEDKKPDFGPETYSEQAARSGAVNVGARNYLIAVNFNLNTKSVESAKEIASMVRESGRAGVPGTLKGCKALGWYIDEYGIAQVSMNITDINETPLHKAYEEVCRVAESLGLSITGTEIVGLVPKCVLTDAGAYFIEKEGKACNKSENELIRHAIRSMNLDDLTPFVPEQKVIEFLMENRHAKFPPIDIVLPWVDGDDPKLNAERLSYMNEGEEALHEDVAGSSRYVSLGEIKYSIASINIFAPFVRKIFIVTDRQDPGLEDYLSKMFPQGHIPIEIVDHKVIFKDYEDYLPVFNSRAIETMVWRIPGLSEHFILMNDDFLFTGMTYPEDFFLGDKTVCYADWFFTPWAKLLKMIKPRINGHRNVGFKDSMLNAISLIGERPFFLCLGHTPRALKKSFYKGFFEKREDAMICNISHKFRHESQFNSQELFYMSEHREGRCVVVPIRRKALYLKPKKSMSYINMKLRKFRRNSTRIFCCINALNLASDEGQQKVMAWAEEMLDQNLRKSL